MIINKILNVKIQNDTYGVILNESFEDKIQFKLFLKMIQSSLALENDLTFFNGEDFLVHIPYKKLKDSLIITENTNYELIDHLKSKLNYQTTKDSE
jgi:PleD family two-component response regulator